MDEAERRHRETLAAIMASGFGARTESTAATSRSNTAPRLAGSDLIFANYVAILARLEARAVKEETRKREAKAKPAAKARPSPPLGAHVAVPPVGEDD